jgi:hypothetical protein
VTGDFTTVSGSGVSYIAEIYKFTGMVQVIHQNLENIIEVDTTAGDVEANLPANPSVGQSITYVNIGTGGNHVTGLPDGITLGDGKQIRLTRGASAWRYEDVTIDEYSGTWANGDYRVTKRSSGSMTMHVIKTTTTTAGVTFVYPETFVDLPYGSGGGQGIVYLNPYPTVSQATTLLYATGGTLTGGTYAYCLDGAWK